MDALMKLMMLIIQLVLLSLALWSAQAFDWHEADNGIVKWTDNCDFNGADIGNRISMGQDCGALCYQRESCTRFVWTYHDGGTCWLKSGDGNAFYASNGGVCGYILRKMNTRRPFTKRRRFESEDLNPRNRCKTAIECYYENRHHPYPRIGITDLPSKKLMKIVQTKEMPPTHLDTVPSSTT